MSQESLTTLLVGVTEANGSNITMDERVDKEIKTLNDMIAGVPNERFQSLVADLYLKHD